MKVLICDDDASTRFVLRRHVEQNFGCAVRECADGVEALTLLGREHFALLLLDLEMPSMSGSEALEEIRASAQTRHLPVIVITRERKEEIIARILRLGIADYIVKPPRAEVIVSKVGRVLKTVSAGTGQRVETRTAKLGPDAPALLVDGNLDYRFFFASQAQKFGPIIQAESGVAALAIARKSPQRLVFLGDTLGIVAGERLVRQLRESQPAGVRVIYVGEETHSATARLCDGIAPRTFVPEKLLASLRPYLFVPGALSAIEETAPGLPDVIGSAATQVFGMMFDAEVDVARDAAPDEATFGATISLTLADRFDVVVAVHMTRETADAVAAKMFGGLDGLAEEDLASTAGELVNLISGRMMANFRERTLAATFGLPTILPVGPMSAPSAGDGAVLGYRSRNSGLFFITYTVADRATAERPQSLSAGETLATPVESA
jgi:two-component system chemotaxis response regulator CheY